LNMDGPLARGYRPMLVILSPSASLRASSAKDLPRPNHETNLR
jgi:hypothetical protein